MSMHSRGSALVRNTSVRVPGVPSDDDLYDAGWAKHWDPNRKAYYYYPIDGSAATTWENPLANRDDSPPVWGSFRIPKQQQKQPQSQGSLHSGRNSLHSGVHSIQEEGESDVESSSSSTGSFANENSFYGDQSQVSLTLSALMGASRMNSFRTTTGTTQGVQQPQPNSDNGTSFNTSSFVNSLRQSLQGSNSLHNSQLQQQPQQQQPEPDNEASMSLASVAEHQEQQRTPASSHHYAYDADTVADPATVVDLFDDTFQTDFSGAPTTGETFDDEHSNHDENTHQDQEESYYQNQEDDEQLPLNPGNRKYGGTDRTPLRMPKPKPPKSESGIDWEAIELDKAILDSQLEIEKKKREYLALFEVQQAKYVHRHASPLAAGCIFILMLILMIVGGYFIANSLIQQAEDAANLNSAPTTAPTFAPIVLPDYTELALKNPVSEQVLAYNWLVNDPNYGRYTKQEKEYRFALMTIYTATGGQNWDRADSFLLPQSAYAMKSHCDFPYYTCPGYVSNITYAPRATTEPRPKPRTWPPTPTPNPDANSTNTTTTAPLNTQAPAFNPNPSFNPNATAPPILPNNPIPTPSPTLAATTTAPLNTQAPAFNPNPNATVPPTFPNNDPTSTPTPSPTLATNSTSTAPQNTQAPSSNPNLSVNPNTTALPIFPGNDPTPTPSPTLATNSTSTAPENTQAPPSNTDLIVNPNATALPIFPSNDPTPILNATNTSNSNTPSFGRQRKLFEYLDGEFANGATLNLTDQGFLQGTLPPEMGLLSELQYVHIANNPGLIGVIPDTIRFWENFLFELILTGNSLSGTIPVTVGQLRHVRALWLNDNLLTGPLPDSLALLSQMTSLRLNNNRFTGTVPSSLASYPYVHEINWASNRLSGPLPTFFVPGAEASQVRSINLQDNLFSGAIPTEYAGLTNLEVLLLHNNINLIGGVPDDICRLPKLKQLTVDCNNIACGCTQCECPTGGNPRKADFLTALPPYTVSAISAGNTPQASAYNWLYSDPWLETYTREQQLQRFALATFYYSTNVPPEYRTWDVRTNWLREGPEGDECNWAQTPRVFYRVPDEVTDGIVDSCVPVSAVNNDTVPLDAFQVLRLSNNSLDGTLPPEIGFLSHLKHLELHQNRIVGTLPSQLGEMTDLRVLDLEGNGLTGTIPMEVMGLPRLNKLYLGGNYLNGTLPTALSRMTQLDTLQLDRNDFVGTIPTEFGLLKQNLERIYLSSNALVGPFPVPEITQMTSLTEIYVADNKLTGSLESLPITEASGLAHVVVSKNEFTGTIPTRFGSMQSIQVLSLNQNQFVGSIPSELGAPSSTLQYLDVSGNLLTSSIPTEITQLGQLVEFRASFNKLVGSLPNDLYTLGLLRILDVSTNRLFGSIPSEYQYFPALAELHVDHNDITGTIPPELGALTNSMVWLDVSWNALRGPVPSELALLTNLQWLYLERNNLNGRIPSEFGQLTSVKELSLYGQQLTGTIPSELGLLSSTITGLFLHENYLEGKIPTELGLLTNLESLWLHQLFLTGSVPAELCNLYTTGKLVTLAVDCLKVSCACKCSCPLEGGDAPRDPLTRPQMQNNNEEANATRPSIAETNTTARSVSTGDEDKTATRNFFRRPTT